MSSLVEENVQHFKVRDGTLQREAIKKEQIRQNIADVAGVR